MKKMPTLFRREFGEDHKIKGISGEIAPGCEWVLRGEGEATEKIDGACCAIINGDLWKRYDLRPGRHKPTHAVIIPCQPAPDPVNGHWPHWMLVDPTRREDRWFVAAFENTPWCRQDGTYEAVGPHFQGNPYGLDSDILEKHGRVKINVPRDFIGIREYLRAHEIEGIVFWRNGEPGCKIKRTDFGFEWPVKRDEE